MESIEKLRLWSHSHDSDWLQDNGDVVFTTADSYDGINYGEYIREMIDEIESEIKSEYVARTAYRVLQREIAERYMELPVDADGVPLRYEDEVVSTEDILRIHMNVVGYSLAGVECMTKATKRIETIRASWLRHVKPRTIEDVLRDLLHDTAHYFPSDCEDDIAKAADEIRGLL